MAACYRSPWGISGRGSGGFEQLFHVVADGRHPVAHRPSSHRREVGGEQIIGSPRREADAPRAHLTTPTNLLWSRRSADGSVAETDGTLMGTQRNRSRRRSDGTTVLASGTSLLALDDIRDAQRHTRSLEASRPQKHPGLGSIQTVEASWQTAEPQPGRGRSSGGRSAHSSLPGHLAPSRSRLEVLMCNANRRAARGIRETP